MPHVRPTRAPGGRRRVPALLILAAVMLVAAACSGPGQGPTPAPTAAPTTPPPPPTATVAAAPAATATTPPSPTATPRPPTATPTARAAASPRPTATPGAAQAATPTGSPFTFSQSPGPFERVGLAGQDIAALAVGGPDGALLYAGGAGVQQSTDGGKTWQLVRTADQAPAVKAIAIAPSDTRTVYVGVSRGCARGGESPGYVSTDGGATWTETGTNLIAFAVDPQNAQLVYAVSCTGVLRSGDAGRTWDTLDGAKVENFDPTLIAIAPSNNQTLYVAYASEGGTVRVRRSDDAGTTWQDANPPGDLTGPLALAVDATDDQAVYLSTLSGVYKSANGGRAWELQSSGLEATTGGNGPAGTRTNSAIIADPGQHDRLWLGTGAGRASGSGVYTTQDGGADWTKYSSGLEGHPIHALALGGTADQRLLYAATDDGIWSVLAR
ncbi:MAG TPA: hypothetical protein VFW96_02050 [Thermomicrobiales bacterium]|nr:hypothetical protein [Thermomicrobiales bacterium]